MPYAGLDPSIYFSSALGSLCKVTLADLVHGNLVLTTHMQFLLSSSLACCRPMSSIHKAFEGISPLSCLLTTTSGVLTFKPAHPGRDIQIETCPVVFIQKGGYIHGHVQTPVWAPNGIYQVALFRVGYQLL